MLLSFYWKSEKSGQTIVKSTPCKFPRLKLICLKVSISQSINSMASVLQNTVMNDSFIPPINYMDYIFCPDILL